MALKPSNGSSLEQLALKWLRRRHITSLRLLRDKPESEQIITIVINSREKLIVTAALTDCRLDNGRLKALTHSTDVYYRLTARDNYKQTKTRA